MAHSARCCIKGLLVKLQSAVFVSGNHCPCWVDKSTLGDMKMNKAYVWWQLATGKVLNGVVTRYLMVWWQDAKMVWCGVMVGKW